MKKVIALTLVAVMLLCGCSVAMGSQEGAAQSKENISQGIGDLFSNIVDNIGDAFEKEEEPLLELGQGAKQASIAILKISINPEFELYLDTDGCISRVRCLNEDAVTAFQTMTSNQINVIGLDYAEAMKVILDSIANTGFLTAETKQIKIESTVQIELAEEDIQTLVESFAEPVEQYSEDNGLTLTVEVSAPEVDTEAEVELPESEVNKGEPNSERTYECELNGVSGTITEYYDENGIQYKLVGEYADGSCHTINYAANGAITYQHDISADGRSTEWYFDEYGNGTKCIINDPDGTHGEITFHSEGVEASRIVSHGDGSYSEEYYTESGVPISSISIGVDGLRSECTWYENGNMKSRITDDSYGHLEYHYFEDGTLSKTIDSSSKGYHEKVYYPNGQVAVDVGSNGERRWDESGKLTYEKCDSYLFENGVLVYYISDGEEITDPELLEMFAIALGLVS